MIQPPDLAPKTFPKLEMGSIPVVRTTHLDPTPQAFNPTGRPSPERWCKKTVTV
jgi:hypothetical protein